MKNWMFLTLNDDCSRTVKAVEDCEVEFNFEDLPRPGGVVEWFRKYS